MSNSNLDRFMELYESSMKEKEELVTNDVKSVVKNRLLSTDLSELVQKRSELVQKRSELAQKRSELVQERNVLLHQHTDLFKKQSEMVRKHAELIQRQTEEVRERLMAATKMSEINRGSLESVLKKADAVWKKAEIAQEISTLTSKILSAEDFDSLEYPTEPKERNFDSAKTEHLTRWFQLFGEEGTKDKKVQPVNMVYVSAKDNLARDIVQGIASFEIMPSTSVADYLEHTSVNKPELNALNSDWLNVASDLWGSYHKLKNQLPESSEYSNRDMNRCLQK